MSLDVAFVSHMPMSDTYGAVGALRETLQSILLKEPDIQIGLVAPDGQIWDSPGRVGLNLTLPMTMNYVGGLPPLQATTWNLYVRSRIGLSAHLGTFDQLLDVSRESSVLHVNSLSLSWIGNLVRSALGRRAPTLVCHIREVADPRRLSRTLHDLSAFDGLICIDSATRRSLSRLALSSSSIPVAIIHDLPTEVRLEDTELARRIRKWASGSPVVGMAGRIDPVKGMAFFASLMREDDNPQWKLVLAGRATRNILRRDSRREFRVIENVTNRFPNRILYLGEISDLSLSGYYRAIDVLVRADSTAGVGLTVHEALSAGVKVVLPGSRRDYAYDSLFTVHADDTFFAAVRSSHEYRSALALAVDESTKRRGRIADLESQRVNHAESLLSAYTRAKNFRGGKSI